MVNFEGIFVKSAVYQPNMANIGYTTHIYIRRRELFLRLPPMDVHDAGYIRENDD